MDRRKEDMEEGKISEAIDRLTEGDIPSVTDDYTCQILDDLNDVKASFMRDTIKTPDLDSEWDRIQTIARGRNHKPSSISHKLWWALGGVGIGVAASITLILFFLKPILSSSTIENHDAVILYSALDEIPDVEMTVTELESSISVANKKDPNSEKQLGLTMKVDGAEVLDMRNLHCVNELEERIIKTPVGKELSIILSDDTEVLLGSESSLRFPTRFSGNRREVWLDGEAYFKVAENKEHPFTVLSKNISTTALGTEFDVKAYERSDIKVALLKGRVKVENIDTQSSVTLEPGQDATNINGKLEVSEIDPKAWDYWRAGYFYFDGEPLVDMMIELGRWYNINVRLNDRALMSYRMHFIAGRDESVSEIVDRINSLNHFNVTFVNNTLTIEKNK